MATELDAMKGECYATASHFANNSAFEVQRTNHFEVVINLAPLKLDGDTGEAFADHIRMSVKEIGAPKITAEAITLKHGNHAVKVAAAPTFEDLQITVYDTLGTDQIKLLQSWFDKVFDHRTKLMGQVKDYKTDAFLYMYSPDCKKMRTWHLMGVWPKDFGQASGFSFDSADAQTIQFTLSTDSYWEDEGKGEFGTSV